MPNKGSLTKAHIVDAVIEQNGFTQKKSIETVEILLELIKSNLESGEDVLISGFGKFCLKQKAKRKGRNPATGEDMILPPRKVVTFQCSGILRDKLNAKSKSTKRKARKIQPRDKKAFGNRQSSNRRMKWPRKKSETSRRDIQ